MFLFGATILHCTNFRSQQRRHGIRFVSWWVFTFAFCRKNFSLNEQYKNFSFAFSPQSLPISTFPVGLIGLMPPPVGSSSSLLLPQRPLSYSSASISLVSAPRSALEAPALLPSLSSFHPSSSLKSLVSKDSWKSVVLMSLILPKQRILLSPMEFQRSLSQMRSWLTPILHGNHL